MRKHRLDLNALVVETFSTASPEPARGTIHGYGNTDTTCLQKICDCPTGGGPTCGETWCGASCTYPCEYTEGQEWSCGMTCETCMAPCVDTRTVSGDPLCSVDPAHCVE